MSPRPIVGLLPAAGRAARLGTLPCSKEIFPVGFEIDAEGAPRPRPVCHPLLRGWAEAGIERALVILRQGKWDIPAHLGSGSGLGLDLAFLVVGETRSVPESLSRAAGWVGALGESGSDVALGFPDILLEPSDVWSRLVEFHRAGDWPISLGLFPTDQAFKADMVDFDEAGRIRQIVIKDPECTLRWTWSIALWRPSFTRYLRDGVAASSTSPTSSSSSSLSQGTELYVGDVIRRAISDGLEARGLTFGEGSFLDVGTPEDLERAIARTLRTEDSP